MKKVFLMALLFILPVGAAAHGMIFNDINTGLEMMEFIEDMALGEEIHEEMEGLMVKMMAGEMSQAEAERMAGFMNKYPGPYSMMMGRLAGFNAEQNRGGGFLNMMPWNGMMGFGGSWAWLWILCWLTWIVAGILAIFWLWKTLGGK